MILECDILYKLNIDLCLSNNNIGGNVCVYEGYTDQKKDVLEINVNSSSNYLKEEIFWRIELLESKHVMVTTWLTGCILYAYYE